MILPTIYYRNFMDTHLSQSYPQSDEDESEESVIVVVIRPVSLTGFNRGA